MFRGFWVTVLAVTLIGCFTPNPPNGALGCNPNGQACPDNYRCLQGACWKNGSFPPATDGGQDLSGPGSPDGGSGGDMAQVALGTACTSDAQCGSNGHCTDGVCCDGTCSGQCEACDVGGHVGTCTAVQGPTHGSRTPCTSSDATCGGSCDGTNRDSCSYPPMTTVCGAACNSHCDGAGTCPAGSGSCPNGFACSNGACGTTCTTNSDCQQNFACSNNTCNRVPESDCLDGVDNNGDGKADCADPTCTDVECVTAPTGGSEVGLLTGTACSGDYGTTEVQHQGPTTTCTTDSCECINDVKCSITAGSISATSTACTSGTALPATTETSHYYEKTTANNSTDLPACTSLPSQSYESTEGGTASLVSSTCRGTGMGTPTVAWSTTTNFCGASRSSNTCTASGQVCVTKPATGGVCMRIPSVSGGCPAGFTTGTTGVYYTSATGGLCSACGCALGTSTPSCGGIDIALYSDNACKTGVGTTEFNAGSCSTTVGLAILGHPATTIASLGALQSAMQTVGFGVVPNCTDTVTKTADATGAVGSTICCQ